MSDLLADIEYAIQACRDGSLEYYRERTGVSSIEALIARVRTAEAERDELRAERDKIHEERRTWLLGYCAFEQVFRDVCDVEGNVPPDLARELLEKFANYRRRKDEAYTERNKLVALLARLVIADGGVAGLGKHSPDPDPSWDPEWLTLVVIDLPTGQVSWHFHDDDAHLVKDLPAYPKPWDGHDTPTKYARVAACSELTGRPVITPHDAEACLRPFDGQAFMDTSATRRTLAALREHAKRVR